jgi:hypothetical protein
LSAEPPGIPAARCAEASYEGLPERSEHMSTPEAYDDPTEDIEAPEADAIEQHLPATDDPESPDFDAIDRTDVDPDTVEADLADVSDQLRVEPIDLDD